MIKLRLSTADSRKNIIVSEDMTPAQVLADNNVVLEGASINLDGMQVTREEFTSPLSSLVSGDSATLSVVVKSGNA
jgi:hypothetical protein